MAKSYDFMKCFFRGEKKAILYMRDRVTNLVVSVYYHEMQLVTLTNMLLLFFNFMFWKFDTVIQSKKSKRFLIEQQPQKIC